MGLSVEAGTPRPEPSARSDPKNRNSPGFNPQQRANERGLIRFGGGSRGGWCGRLGMTSNRIRVVCSLAALGLRGYIIKGRFSLFSIINTDPPRRPTGLICRARRVDLRNRRSDGWGQGEGEAICGPGALRWRGKGSQDSEGDARGDAEAKRQAADKDRDKPMMETEKMRRLEERSNKLGPPAGQGAAASGQGAAADVAMSTTTEQKIALYKMIVDKNFDHLVIPDILMPLLPGGGPAQFKALNQSLRKSVDGFKKHSAWRLKEYEAKGYL